MSYPVIDSVTQQTSFGALFWKESFTTTLTLVEISEGKFGLSYDAKYSGIKDGSVSGGPIAIYGDGTTEVNADPKVLVIISGYDDTGTTISMNVKITVAIPVLGTKTIFDAKLGGKYGVGGWSSILNHLSEVLQKS